MDELTIDSADLVYMTKIYTEAHENDGHRSFVNDIDNIIQMASKFSAKYSAVDWQDSKFDWESALYQFYNEHCDAYRWERIKIG